MVQGVRLAYFGELAESGDILRGALRSAEQLAGPRGQALAANGLTINLMQSCRWQETVDVVDRAIEIAPDFSYRICSK
ncbi:MAG: hypothetical protein ACLPVY_23610 [Acidimicrobiia bacterium]